MTQAASGSIRFRGRSVDALGFEPDAPLSAYPDGDVTVIGSVASGADVIAAGSIHIYGALRGRAFAGAEGKAQSRILCRRLEAELIAVGGVFLTADEMGMNVRGQPIQAWLERDSIRIARLD